MSLPTAPSEDDDHLSPHHNSPHSNSPLPQADNDAVGSTFDSALRLIPPPLAGVARAAAATAPFQVDDLTDLDLGWGGPATLDDPLGDQEGVQYLQLHLADAPVELSQPTEAPTRDAFSAAATSAQPKPESPDAMDIDNQSAVATAVAPAAVQEAVLPSSLPSYEHPARAGPIDSPRRPRMRAAPQSQATSSPIRIAPRVASGTTSRPAATRGPETAASSPLPPTPSPRHAAPPFDPPPTGGARAAEDAGRAPRSVAGLSLAHGIPMMNMAVGMGMYPLQQHCQPAFLSGGASQPEGGAEAEAEAAGGTPLLSRFSPVAQGNKKMRVEGPMSTSAGGRGSQTVPHAAQFIPPGMPMMAPGMLSYDPSMMHLPLLVQQQMYMAAAAAYAHGLMPPMSSSPGGIRRDMVHPVAGAGTGQGGQARFARGGAQTSETGSLAGSGRGRPDGVRNTGGGEISENDAQAHPLRMEQAQLEGHPTRSRQLHMQNATIRSVKVAGAEEGSRAERQTTRMEGARGVESAAPPPSRAFPQTTGSGEQAARSESQGGGSQYDGSHGRSQRKRLVWTPELHERFVKAIDAVGLNQAVPKVLVTIMNVEGLTTEHVKSHLQKYRNSLRKEAVEDARERRHSTTSMACDMSGTVHAASTRGGGSDVAVDGGGVTIRPSVSADGEARKIPALPTRISVLGAPLPHKDRLARTASGKDAVCKGSSEGLLETVDESAATHATKEDAPSKRLMERGKTENHFAGTSPSLGDGAVSGALPGETAAGNASADVARIDPAGYADATGGSAFNVASGSEDPDLRIASNAADGVERAFGVKAAGDARTSVQGSDAQIRNGGGNREKTGATSGRVEVADDGAEGRKVAGAAISEGESGSNSRDQEMWLELVNQKTLQMQLQLQMMVHRTIAVQRKMQLDSSKPDQGTGSITGVAPSGQSGVDGQRDADVAKGAVVETQACEDATHSKEEARDVKAVKRQGGKRRSDVASASGDAEVTGILEVQLEMRRVLEEQHALIREHLSREESKAKDGG